MGRHRLHADDASPPGKPPAALRRASRRRRRRPKRPPARRLDPESLLDGLNGPQRDAVTHAGSPLLIVAGAGSGKTRVLTHRIAYLLAERDVHPGEIIAITFTNKAAGEMKERVGRAGRPAGPADVGVHVPLGLRAHPARRARARRAEEHVLDLRRGRLAAADAAGGPRARPRPEAVPGARPGRPGVEPEERAGRARRSSPTARRARTSARSPRRTRSTSAACSEAHALDFDDIIMATVHLLQSHPHVAEAYRRRFRHVLVDEYQDTNHAQYMLVKELVGPAERRAAAGRAVRGRRRRPVDLRVPRRDDPQHPGVRARLPERAHDPARAELPLHPDDPVRGQRGDRPQLVAQAQAAVERPGRRRADRRVRRRHRARRGRLGGPRDRPARRQRRASAPATWRSSTAPTRSPGCSRRCSSGSGCRTRWSAGCASTSARRSATRWRTCGRSSTTTTRSASAGC